MISSSMSLLKTLQTKSQRIWIKKTMCIYILIHLLIEEVQQETNTTQVQITIFKEVLQIELFMTIEADLL